MTPGRGVRFWGPPAAYFVLIFALSSFTSLPEPPGISLNLLHYPEFGVLSFLFARAIHGERPGRSRPGVYLLALVLTAICGALDEFHQAFVPGRLADIHDFVHDFVGAVGGLAAWACFREVLFVIGKKR